MDLKIGVGKYQPQRHERSQNIPTKPGFWLGFWVRVIVVLPNVDSYGDLLRIDS